MTIRRLGGATLTEIGQHRLWLSDRPSPDWRRRFLKLAESKEAKPLRISLDPSVATLTFVSRGDVGADVPDNRLAPGGNEPLIWLVRAALAEARSGRLSDGTWGPVVGHLGGSGGWLDTGNAAGRSLLNLRPPGGGLGEIPGDGTDQSRGGSDIQAILDVEEAVSDWNDVLARVNGAPELVLVSGVKKADIIIQMKVGGGSTLGSALPRTSTPFSCDLKVASIQLSGKAFGFAFSSTGTRNVARHEIGHALGLGHSDNPNDLMHPTFESSEFLGSVDVPITKCDKDGLEAIYPLPTPLPTACSAIPDSVNCP